MFLSIVALLSFTLQATASPVDGAKCFDLVIPVHVETQSYPLLFPELADGYQAVELLLQATKRDADPDTTKLLGKPTNLSITFPIPATYCSPSGHGKKSSTVQLMTHGLGFDRSYWNLDKPADNYLAAATAAGYSTLSYDRLGTGHSPMADPYKIVQTQVELAILVEITTLLRAGKISAEIPAAKKVVHVGHSFGSLLSNGLVSSRPELSDGVVLTGFSHYTQYQQLFLVSTTFHLASENQPARFAGVSSGYVTWGDKYANQYSFLKYPFFYPEVLDKGEANKMPFTVGEFITFPLAPIPSPNYTKPVLLMAADSDLIFCGADCVGLVNGPDSPTFKVFANAKPLEIYIQPNSGHGMNLHKNATGWYGVVNNFLDAHVL